jgi:hypothetical protein
MGIMYGLVCGHCGKKFCSYPDRKGQRGQYPKFCGRDCYTANRRALSKSRPVAVAVEDATVKVPAKFYDDHDERGCEPFCEPVRRSARFVWLRLDDPGIHELYDDATHYADEDGGPDAYEGSAAMRRSAVATVRAILDAERAQADAMTDAAEAEADRRIR